MVANDRKLPSRLVILALASLGLFGCGRDPMSPRDDGPGGTVGGGDGAQFGQAVQIKLTDGLRFQESVVVVPAGSMVRWISASSLGHTVTPRGHEEFERSETRQQGWVMMEHVFNTPGTYPFYCEYHKELGMTGTIIVRSGP